MAQINSKDEQNYFDRAFESEVRKSVSKYYSITKNSRKYYDNFLFSNCNNKKILEYGCGKGSYSLALSRHGGKVTGIDISEIAIKLSKENALKHGSENTVFLVMDAEEMSFKNNSFDIVCGTGILHHLNIDKALKEITRVLKPNGKAIFIEPMGHNPAINLFRKSTPILRTRDEHPLTKNDLGLIKEYFHIVNYRFFYLFSLLSIPFRNTKKFATMLNFLDSLDKKLFDLMPPLRLLAWQVAIIMENKINSIKKDLHNYNN